jgi:hypothetical protein
MKNKLILLVIFGCIFLLYRTNPDFDNHVSKIGSVLLETSDVTEEPDEQLREGLEYKDYTICSATQNKKRGTMVSIGIFRTVKVVDTQWAVSYLKIR